MKTIKFRAWHKAERRIYPVSCLYFEGIMTVTLVGHLYNWKEYSIGEEVELMQFTGLKDKNGKEVYEGDIIKCHDGIAESYFNSVVEWQIRELTHEVATVPLEVSGFIIGSLSEVEVIGNIYENPELFY